MFHVKQTSLTVAVLQPTSDYPFNCPPSADSAERSPPPGVRRFRLPQIPKRPDAPCSDPVISEIRHVKPMSSKSDRSAV